MKILSLSKNQIYKRNWGRELFKLDIKKYHDIIFYGNGYKNNKKFIPDIINEIEKPDIIFSFVWAYASEFYGYELISEIPKIHWEVDYVFPKDSYCGTVHVQDPFYKNAKYDLIFGVTKRMVMDMKKSNVAKKIEWLPFSVSIDKYKNLNLEKEIDLMATFNTNEYLYPNRKYLQKIINNLNYKSFTTPVVHDEYIEKINKTKIFVNHTNVYNSLSMKYTEVLACGTLLLSNHVEDLNDIGLKDGEHLIIYNDWDDMVNKIDYYLNHDNEREEIAENGMRHIINNHSNDIRIKEMTEIINNEVL